MVGSASCCDFEHVLNEEVPPDKSAAFAVGGLLGGGREWGAGLGAVVFVHGATCVEVGEAEFGDAGGEIGGLGGEAVAMEGEGVEVIRDGPDGAAPVGVGIDDGGV